MGQFSDLSGFIRSPLFRDEHHRGPCGDPHRRHHPPVRLLLQRLQALQRAEALFDAGQLQVEFVDLLERAAQGWRWSASGALPRARALSRQSRSGAASLSARPRRPRDSQARDDDVDIGFRHRCSFPFCGAGLPWDRNSTCSGASITSRAIWPDLRSSRTAVSPIVMVSFGFDVCGEFRHGGVGCRAYCAQSCCQLETIQPYRVGLDLDAMAAVCIAGARGGLERDLGRVVAINPLAVPADENVIRAPVMSAVQPSLD